MLQTMPVSLKIVLTMGELYKHKDPKIRKFCNLNITIINSRETSQDSLINFSDESCQQNNDNFPAQFLSMPELDPEPPQEKSGVELLAEFDIDHDIDQGIITRKIGEKNEHNSLNCVLPSISNDQNDDVSMAEVIFVVLFVLNQPSFSMIVIVIKNLSEKQ